MTESITSLADLAAQANENHQLAISTAGSALEFARLSGAALIEAKSLVGHGDWLPWLDSNFKATERTARRYMQLALNRTCVSDLKSAKSINEALRMIAGEDEEELEEETLEPAEEEPTPTQHGAIQDAEITSEEPRAVAVEIVEEDEGDTTKDEEEEIPKPEPYRPAQALAFATMAIAQLERIDKRDTEREAAFKKIIAFCNKKLNNK